MSERILVFVPCYNCGPQIGRVVAQFERLTLPGVEELLILDNGSSDDTLAQASAAMARLDNLRCTLGTNRQNYHLGGSHKAAFAYAEAHGFSHVIVLHGDDQGDIRDLVDVVRRGDHLCYQACLGARFMRGARLQGYSAIRTLGNRVFNALFTLVAGRPIHDLGSGLNIFARSVFADPAVLRASDDLRFNIYLLLGMIDRRQSIRFFPISWREDDQLSNVRLASQALRTLAIAWQYWTARKRFRHDDHRDRSVEHYGFDIVAQQLLPEPVRG